MSRREYKIVALPGDGIGPEVLQASLNVLDAVSKIDGAPQLIIETHEAGAEHYRRAGVAFPVDVRQACLDADAVLLAAIGLPDVRKPDGTEVQPEMMMGLRQALGVYAAVRPVKLYPGVQSPLRDVERGIDLIILRENLEGLFASFGGGCMLDDRVATDIAAEATYVDAMSLYLVQNPAAYDVLVMENQFGDILSDLGAGIVGGLGMGPSAEIGDNHALFQPSHGSAPQLTGKDVANPIAMILSAAMMLEWLSERHRDPAAAQAANRIEQAVTRVLAAGQVATPDIGGTSTTSDVARAVVAALTTL